MPTCINHPTVPAEVPCPNCGRPFCDACLVEFMGQRLCGPCRDLKLAAMQGPGNAALGEDGPRAGTGTVDIGGWLSAGWSIIQPELGAFILAAFLAGLLSSFSCGIVYGPLTSGLFMMCFARMTYGRSDTSHFWMGFRRFGNAFLVTFLVFLGVLVVDFGVSLVLGLSAGLAGATNPRVLSGVEATSQVLGFGVETAASALFLAPTLFALPLVAARNVNAIDALRISWTIFLRNPGGFLLTAVVFEVVRRAGLALCCVGALVTVPLTLAAQAKAFSDYFRVEGWDRVV